MLTVTETREEPFIFDATYCDIDFVCIHVTRSNATKRHCIFLRQDYSFRYGNFARCLVKWLLWHPVRHSDLINDLI